MHPMRHAKALVRDCRAELVHSEVRAERRTTAALAAQVVEAAASQEVRVPSYLMSRNPLARAW